MRISAATAAGYGWPGRINPSSIHTGNWWKFLPWGSDITALKQTEEEREHLLVEVQRRAAELTATFNSIADGLMIQDRNGKLLYMNVLGERLLGYAPKMRTLSACKNA